MSHLKLLNFGAGNPIPNWINIDASPYFKISRHLHKIMYYFGISKRSKFFLNTDYKYYKFSQNKKLMFNDNSINYIYCSHVFEHLLKEDIEPLLNEFNRILVHNGVARIIVPDLMSVLKREMETSPIISLNDSLGTIPKALKQSRFISALEAISGFPSFHKIILNQKKLEPIFKNKWRKYSIDNKYLESDIPTNLLKSIELQDRCVDALIIDLVK